MKQNVFKKADILLPKAEIDLEKWCIVACDQYTSQPEYWQEVEKEVGPNVSTYHIIFPEVYLEEEGREKRIEAINQTMETYLKDGIFQQLTNSYIYVERKLECGVVRHGLIGMVDLEQYDYNKGSQSAIRATEGTVLSRIPPRVQIRENAALETPHIMLLIDDREDQVIGPLKKRKGSMQKVYETALMQLGGYIEGYVVDPQGEDGIEEGLNKLYNKDAFCEKYQVDDKGVLLFAVGDGNHSLATAKECYERLKKKLSPQQALAHPARFALVEVVNLHDASLDFEPIHRVVFDIEAEDLLQEIARFHHISDHKEEGQSLQFVCEGKEGWITLQNPSHSLTVGSLQQILDEYLQKHPAASIDYIHGDKTAITLGKKSGNIAFLLPTMEKEELFCTVIQEGSLPRKTFSMGHAWDKRYYLECRKIKK
jgi:uncharacterized protein (DUF1015 family)